MDFKTNELKTGVIRQQLLSTLVQGSCCYALLTNGNVIKFDCKTEEDSNQIALQLRGSFFNIESFKLMQFTFKITVLKEIPHHSF